MSFIDWKITFFTIIIGLGLALLYTISKLSSSPDIPAKTIKKPNIISEHASSGDLLGVSFRSVRGKLVRVWTGSIWTHVGVVVTLNKTHYEYIKTHIKKFDKLIKSNNDKYVMEVANYGSEYWNRGLVLKPLDDWLKYNNENYVSWRHINAEIPERSILDFIHEHKMISTDMFVGRWLNTMFNKQYTKGCKDKYYCTEFVAHFYHYVGVLSKTRDSACYTPRELVYGEIELTNGLKFYEPILLVQ